MYKNPVVVEIFYSSAWHNITSDVMTSSSPITITRGRSDESQQVSPGQMTLILNNNNATYSPRNPMSALYGLIGRNTPIRVSMSNPSKVVTEDFEDTDFSFSITQESADYAGVNLSTAQHHGGAKSMVIHSGSTSDDISIVVPVGATSMTFWVYTANSGSPNSLVVNLDGVQKYTTAAITINTWTQVTIDVTGGTLIEMFGLGSPPSSIRDAYVDDMSFTGISDVRFVGEIESWQQTWNLAETVATVPIQAYGILRRLGGAGTQATAFSPLTRLGRYGINGVRPTGWWPLEVGDKRETTSTPSGITDVMPMTAVPNASTGHNVSDVVGGNATGPVGSPTAIDLKPGGQLKGVLPVPSGVGAFRYEMAVQFANWVASEGFGQTFWLLTNGFEYIRVWAAPTAGQELRFVYEVPAASPITNYQSHIIDDGDWHWLTLDVWNVSGIAHATLTADGTAVFTNFNTTKTFVVPNGHSINSTGEMGAAAQAFYWTFSSVNDMPDPSISYAAFNAYAGEQAHERVERICAEESIIISSSVGSGSALVGPQPVASALAIVREAADADGGILAEDRAQLGLTFNTHASLYDQVTTVTLDYSAGGEVAPPLQPLEDTSHIANDITVTRQDGGSSQVIQETGPLNVSEPVDDPQGVGRYPVSVTLNLYTDDQTLQQAAWRRHLGTWDEPRYPSVSIDLTAMHEAGKTSLMTSAVDLDVSNRIQVDNPPAWQGPEYISQRVQGYAETLGSHHWTLVANTSPARPYDVGILGTDRLDTSGSTLTSNPGTGTATIDVTSPGALWSSAAKPYDIVIDGERMTVTNVTGAGPGQTLTVTRSVNGVVKTHASGAAVRLYSPLRLAR